ncbi:O-antigen chain-terminating methyltransferase [Ectothiorhodospira magna]|uniref:O-antigen chain-terminating methyltransferase n=1 Tax=Ectothiorhodospira magna TaxID=867345 RepID=A0A1H9BKJ6_9GAMM|nr:class I SAM-dependent methyltransferase [Ectothiorhodospira magna]SEP89494.1 O-antigen chain-terminating methyltransferase [Ectothiorhodospira magna]
MKSSISPELLAALPELYQPVYGHPECSAAAMRPCQDRLDRILAVHDALQQHLGRPPRVLDLGCAQGFFSLHLAARGAQVQGIDSDPASIALCQALAAEHPDLTVTFTQATVESLLEDFPADQYDLILGLSVLHHLIHAHGQDTISQWLTQVRAGAAALILELALKEEPLPWAESLPADPLEILGDSAFIHPLGHHPTHLSDLPRPLLVVSDRYWILPPGAGPIDSHTQQSHDLAQGHYQGTRRYYRSGDRLIKHFRFDAPPAFDNSGELAREIHQLTHPPAGFTVPALLDYGSDPDAGWLIRQWWPGHLLLDELRQGPLPDHAPVLLQVLDQLATLEAAGLYHNDLRPWNLLRRDDGTVALIDYGAIVPQPVDRAWPGSPHLAVFILIHELVSGQVHHPEPLRPAAISPWGLPPPYRQWAARFWDTPPAQWRFARMRDSLQALLTQSPEEGPPLLPPQRWIADMEQAVDIHGRSIAFLHWRHDQYTQHVSSVEARAFEAESHALDAERRARESERRAHDAEIRAREADQQRHQTDHRLRDAETALAVAKAQERNLLTRLRALQDQQQAAQHQHQQAQSQISQLQAELDDLHHYAARLAAAEAALRHSLSWRLTAPLRHTVERLRQGRQWLSQLPARLRHLPHLLIRALAAQVLGRPRLKTLALTLLARLPALRRTLEHHLLTPPTPASITPPPDLPPTEAWARAALRRHRSS